jgi:DNA-binding CsgD family transcriptional regulator
LLLVSGEPGIGKTRLVEELAVLAVDQGARVIWGRVDDVEGTPPYWPWIQLLEDVLDGDDAYAIGEALDVDAGPISAILPKAKQFVAEISYPPLLDPATARFQLHQSIAGFLGRISGRRRLVVVLEDMQWADVASLELTMFLAARLSTAPVLLVITYRSVDGGSSESFGELLGGLARLACLERIVLTGLSEAEAGRFMAQTIGLRSRPAVVAGVHARTEGNPFFIGELARLLQSEGLLGAAATPGQDLVPVGVRDVIRRRLARLPAPAQEMLMLAAVVGRDFDLAVLAASAEAGIPELIAVIEPALVAGLINEFTGAVGRLRFSHALVRDTVYGELSALRRATLHARVGAGLERQRGGALPLAALAEHFFQAAPVLGPEHGLGYALSAAEEAQAALAYERVEEQLRRALMLTDLLPLGRARSEQELHVQNRLGRLLVTTRGSAAPTVAQTYARAEELCRELGETEELFDTLYGLAGFHTIRGDCHVLAELSRQFLAVGELTSSAQWLAAGHGCAAGAQLHLGQLHEARSSFQAAVAQARLLVLSGEVADRHLQHPLPLCLARLGLCALLAGDEPDALALNAEAYEVAKTLSHPMTLVFAVYFNAFLRVLMQDAPGCEAWAGEGIELCDRYGVATFRRWFEIFRTWAIVGQGHTEAHHLDDIRAVFAADAATGERVGTVLFLGLIADVETAMGNGEGALAVLDDALAVVNALDQRQFEPELHRKRGELLAARGPEHLVEAAESFRVAISVADHQGAVLFKQRAEVALLLLGQTQGPALTKPPAIQVDPSNLSPRERELLALVGRGLTDKQVAVQLSISLATVHSHLDRIRDKTGQRRRAELTRLAVELGLVPR